MITVLMHLIKGGDMFLREHQKKKIQEYFDAAAIHLDDLRPLSWFQKISSSGFVACFIVISVPLAAYGLFFTYSAGMNRLIASLAGMMNGTLLFIFKGILFLGNLMLSLVLLGIGVYCTHEIVEWLLGDDPRFTAFLRRFLIFAVGGGVSLLLIHILVSSLTYVFVVLPLPETVPGRTWVNFMFSREGMVVMAAYSSKAAIVYLVYAMPLVVSIFIILSQTVLLIAELVVGAARAICWRIVEYNKGAWSAILALLTIVLGLVELRLKGYG